MFTRWTFALGLGVVCLPALAGAGEWAQFRGPGGAGVSAETQLPEEWSIDKNIAWKTQVPGYGWSSPIVWGDKVFVTTAVSDKQKKPSAGFGGGMGGFGGPGGFGRGGRPPDDVYQWQVYCLSAADGTVLWKQTAAEHKPATPINGSNTYASETPVTDGEHVYAYFGMTGVFCYDFTGKQLWKADLGAYRMMFGHGSGASPALDGARLFIQCDNEEKSFLVALDTKTGKELWRAERPERTSWGTPLVWKTKERTEVVCISSPRVRSYDAATGKQLWELGGLSGQCHATPVAGEDLVYVGSGGGPTMGGFGGRPGGRSGGGFGNRPLFAVKAGASGDLTLKEGEKSNDGVAWTLPQGGPPMASPLVVQGYVYILEEHGGTLTCLDAKTGKQAYRERLPGARGFTASPVAYQGKLFCTDEDGHTFVVQAGAEFKLLGENKLDEMCWSSPAVAGGALFLRTVDHLYCVRPKSGDR
jgi:outer membrane protein assembly factor BamB